MVKSLTRDWDYLLKDWFGLSFQIYVIGLMHDDVLLINFTTTPHSHALFARFFHLPCLLNVRLGGEIDQQNVIMHKACWIALECTSIIL